MAFKFPKSLKDVVKANAAAMRFYGVPEDKITISESLKHLAEPKRKHTKKAHTVKTGLSELQEQIRVIQWWDAHHEEFGLASFVLFAIPNGGGRDLFGAANLKRSGVRSGIEDLFLSAPSGHYHGCFVEMKVEDGGKLSVEQSEVLHAHSELGYRAVVAFGHQQAIDFIKSYLIDAK